MYRALASYLSPHRLVRGLGALPVFSSSAQCTEVANNARRLIFMILRSLNDLSKSVFIPFSGASARPYLAIHASTFTKRRSRYQKF